MMPREHLEMRLSGQRMLGLPVAFSAAQAVGHHSSKSAYYSSIHDLALAYPRKLQGFSLFPLLTYVVAVCTSR